MELHVIPRCTDRECRLHNEGGLHMSFAASSSTCLRTVCSRQDTALYEACAPATRFQSARENVAPVSKISSRISRLRLESSSMLIYSSVSSMYSPAQRGVASVGQGPVV